MPWLILGVFMVCLRVNTVCVSDSLFRVGLINSDKEHLGSCNSARELREGHEGVGYLIGNFGG